MNLKQGTEFVPTGKNWIKLLPIQKGDLHVGCANCSTAEYIAPMDLSIPVGYGSSDLMMDKTVIWDENEGTEITIQQAEDMAAKDPDHDWRIHRYGAMHGETYQRHGTNKWVCVESNPGFA